MSIQSKSVASTTMSEFVNRTFPPTRRQMSISQLSPTPSFGYNTLNTADILQAVTGVDDRLRRLERQATVLTPLEGFSEMSESPPEPTEQELDALLTMSDTKMRLLLSTSLLDSSRVIEYMAKFHAVQHAIRKQQKARAYEELREQACDLVTFKVTDAEIASAFTSDQLEDVEKLARKIGANTPEQVAIVQRACVHDSMFEGRDSNRMMALLGDGALAVMLKAEALERGVPTVQIDYALKATQSNDKLRDLCVRLNLHRLIILDSRKVDRDSRIVAATFLEALFGAIYLIGGTTAVKRINDKHIKVCVFDEIFKEYPR